MAGDHQLNLKLGYPALKKVTQRQDLEEVFVLSRHVVRLTVVTEDTRVAEGNFVALIDRPGRRSR